MRVRKQRETGNSLSKILQRNLIILTATSIIILGIVWIVFGYIRFKQQNSSLTESILQGRREMIKGQVQSAIFSIRTNQNKKYNNLIHEIQNEVNDAAFFSDELCKNIDPDDFKDKRIISMLKSSLRSILSEKKYLNMAIFDTTGQLIVSFKHKEREGHNFINLTDKQGNKVVKNELSLLKNRDFGLLKYSEYSTDSTSNLHKVSYVKKLKNYPWYIVAKIYMSDYDKMLQDEMLNYISSLRFGNSGYFFVYDTISTPLILNGEKIISPRNNKYFNQYVPEESRNLVLKELNNLSKEDGEGFLQYHWTKPDEKTLSPKLSYIYYYKEWGWIIGAGTYLNDINKHISSERKVISANLAKDISILLFTMIILMAMAAWQGRRIAGYLADSFSRFGDFFSKGARDAIFLQTSQFHYSEFKRLAISANAMIEARNRAIDDLANERSLLRSLIDATPDMIFVKSPNGKYVDCNKAFAEYLELNHDEIINKYDADLFNKELKNIYISSDKEVIRNPRKVFNIQNEITFPDGSVATMDTLKTVFYNKHNDVIGIIGISRDITGLKKIHKQLERAKIKAEESDMLKTAFLANMSHEIRTPMNAIIGFSSLLQEDNLTPDERHEYINQINTNGDSLLNLINDIIDISKIESGQLKVEIETVDICKILAELKQSSEENIARRGKSHDIKIHLETPQNKLVWIDTDPFRFRQLCTNLIDNAIKFTNSGSITIGMRPILSNTNQLIEFYVKDTGIGIPQSKQQTIFERFRQIEESYTRNYGGTGLGLAICQNIVALLGGDIGVRSEENMGSEFYFTLPGNMPDLIIEQSISRKIITPNNFYHWHNKTILVTEDVLSNFRFIEMALKKTAVKLIWATNGEEALHKFESIKNIDLILMDIQMPKMNGIEATQKIRMLSPSIPIIALSAYTQKEEHLKMIEAGCNDFLVKPIQLNALINCIDTFFTVEAT